MKATKNWYTISEAAKHLGVSPDTLRRWEKLGKILPPTRTAGFARRYSADLLDKILSGEATTQPKAEEIKKEEPKEKPKPPFAFRSPRASVGKRQKLILIAVGVTVATLAILLPLFLFVF